METEAPSILAARGRMCRREGLDRPLTPIEPFTPPAATAMPAG